MKRLLILTPASALVLALVLGLLVAPAAAAVKLSGSLTPQDDGAGSNYACAVASTPIDAQDGPDVILKANLTVPSREGYWVEVGLVPEAAYNDYQSGAITSLWDEGVYVLAYLDTTGQFLVAAEDYPLQARAPARYTDTGQLALKLALKPRVARKGGSATLRINRQRTDQGRSTLAYGKPAEGLSRSEDYSAAHLVVQVRSDAPQGTTQFTATVKQLRDALSIAKVISRDAAGNKCKEFQPGHAAVIQTVYWVLSTRNRRLLYDIRGEVTLFGSTQSFTEQNMVGKYGFSRMFLVPLNAKPGKYRARVTLRMVRRLTNRESGEPCEELLYTEEATTRLTVQ